MKNKKDFNIVIVGTGGQGSITLLQILARAASIDGNDVRTSELHGLSQRGGSVEVQMRFGKKIFSPMVAEGGADLILGLEAQECLKSLFYANSETVYLINKFFIPIFGKELLKEQAVLKELKKVTKNVFIVPASDICEEELGKKVVAGMYLLSLACVRGLIPIKPESVLQAIKDLVPEKYLDLNKKTFELALSKKNEEI